MVNNYKTTTYNTKSKYKEIESVTFYPTEKVEYKKIHNAGDKLWWKWLGFIPLIPHKFKRDTFEIKRNGYLNTRENYKNGATLEQIRDIVEYRNEYYYMDGLDIISKALVRIKFNSNRWDANHYFNTNEEAMKYVEELKTICKKVGNDLD